MAGLTTPWRGIHIPSNRCIQCWPKWNCIQLSKGKHRMLIGYVFIFKTYPVSAACGAVNAKLQGKGSLVIVFTSRRYYRSHNEMGKWRQRVNSRRSGWKWQQVAHDAWLCYWWGKCKSTDPALIEQMLPGETVLLQQEKRRGLDHK